ncbi:hypothetical protein DF034_32280 [Burkholderia anthina]|nr:hypothetical protein DF034_32280 [Burkholderia anthina]
MFPLPAARCPLPAARCPLPAAREAVPIPLPDVISIDMHPVCIRRMRLPHSRETGQRIRSCTSCPGAPDRGWRATRRCAAGVTSGCPHRPRTSRPRASPVREGHARPATRGRPPRNR